MEHTETQALSMNDIKQTDASPFLGLPDNIRLKIYTYLGAPRCDEEGFTLITCYFYEVEKKCGWQPHTALRVYLSINLSQKRATPIQELPLWNLSQTCRQIREEIDNVLLRKLAIIPTSSLGSIPGWLLPDMLLDRPSMTRSIKSIKISWDVSLSVFKSRPHPFSSSTLHEFFTLIAEQFNLNQLILYIRSDWANAFEKVVNSYKDAPPLPWLEPLLRTKTQLVIKVEMKQPWYDPDTTTYPEDLTEDQIEEWFEEKSRQRIIKEKEYQAQFEALFRLPPTSRSEMQLYVDQRLK